LDARLPAAAVEVGRIKLAFRGRPMIFGQQSHVLPKRNRLSDVMRNSRAFATSRTHAITSVRRVPPIIFAPLWATPSRELERFGKFTLERISANGELSFKANGEIDFFGEEAFTQLSGAGGPDRTVCSFEFSLPIEA
jgi:hypothetical protein